MKKSQKIAISYAIRERAKKRREAFILKEEGSLELFKKSKYKSLHWYILSKYGTMIY